MFVGKYRGTGGMGYTKQNNNTMHHYAQKKTTNNVIT
jgi:hypothetical protein